MNLFGQSRLLDDPGQVRGFDAAVTHRASDAEACRFRTRSGIIQKLGYDLAEFAVFTAGENALRNQLQMPILGLEISQPGIGPTNIAGQDHFSKFLQRRPSRSRSSSASFGPHVPDA